MGAVHAGNTAVSAGSDENGVTRDVAGSGDGT